MLDTLCGALMDGAPIGTGGMLDTLCGDRATPSKQANTIKLMN